MWYFGFLLFHMQIRMKITDFFILLFKKKWLFYYLKIIFILLFILLFSIIMSTELYVSPIMW